MSWPPTRFVNDLRAATTWSSLTSFWDFALGGSLESFNWVSELPSVIVVNFG